MDSNTPICFLSSLIILLQVVLLGRTKEKEEVQKIVSEDEILPPRVEDMGNYRLYICSGPAKLIGIIDDKTCL